MANLALPDVTEPLNILCGQMESLLRFAHRVKSAAEKDLLIHIEQVLKDIQTERNGIIIEFVVAEEVRRMIRGIAKE